MCHLICEGDCFIIAFCHKFIIFYWGIWIWTHCELLYDLTALANGFGKWRDHCKSWYIKISTFYIDCISYNSLCIQTGQRAQLLYTNGCYGEFESLIENALPILGGIVLGIFVLEVNTWTWITLIWFLHWQVLSIFLAIGLIVDIRNEKIRAQQWRKRHPKQGKKKQREHENFTLVVPSRKWTTTA